MSNCSLGKRVSLLHTTLVSLFFYLFKNPDPTVQIISNHSKKQKYWIMDMGFVSVLYEQKYIHTRLSVRKMSTDIHFYLLNNNQYFN